MGFGIKQEFVNGLEGKTQEPAAPATEPVVDNNVTPTEPVAAEPATDVTPAEPVQPAAEPAQAPITDDAVLEYLRSQKKIEVNSFDDLLKKPEPVKEVINPYADIEQDDEVRSFLNYAKETKRGLTDYLKLKEDVDKVPALEIARQRVRTESGISTLTDDEADKYLEKKLNIDLSDSNIDAVDLIELEAFAKPIRDARRAEKEQYLKPIEKPVAPTEEMITLENGQQVTKVQHEQIVARQNYLHAIKASVDSVADVSVKLNVGDKDAPIELTLTHEYLPEGRHSMQSMAGDIDSTVKRLFGEGEKFNHADFQEAVWYLDKNNREKFASNIAQQAYAQAIAEMLKDEHNVNFNRNRMPGVTTPKTNVANVFDRPGFGVKFPI